MVRRFQFRIRQRFSINRALSEVDVFLLVVCAFCLFFRDWHALSANVGPCPTGKV